MWTTLTIFTGCLLVVVYCAPPTTTTTTSGKKPQPPTQAKCRGLCPFPDAVCVRKHKCKTNCYFCAVTSSIPEFPKNAPNPSELAAMIAKKAASAAAAAAAATNAQALASQSFQQNRQQQMPKQTTDPFDFFGNLFTSNNPTGTARTFNNLLGWQMMGLGGMDGILPFN